MLKTCFRCKLEKDLSCFRLRSGKSSLQYKSEAAKRHSSCKSCERLQQYENEGRKWVVAGFNATRGRGRAVSGAALRKLWTSICYLCGEPQLPGDTELDHVYPISKGGADSVDNLRWVHKACNRIKHDLTLGELRDHLKRMISHLGTVG